MATVILKNLVTGETSGGVFTLTSITNGNYPTTIYDVNLASNVTFNSAADLPYSFTAGVPYDAIVTTLSTTKGGTYNFDYCVSNCGVIECSTSSVTMVEKPIMGTSPTIYRCGINGVYGSVSACYLGGVTKTSDGTTYTDPLTTIQWLALTGGWVSNGNCVTIPNTVPETTFNLSTQSVTGACTTSTTFNLVNKNIYAGNALTKNLCLDKHQIEAYKNAPGGSIIALVNMDDEINTTQGLFPKTGAGGCAEIFPSGATKVWSFVSGPSVIPFTTTRTADFKNAVVGTYVFRKTITFGSCVHTTDFTAIVKFCTLGDQVVKVQTNCKLNTSMVMNVIYPSLINSAYNPISTAGCWSFLGTTVGTQLDIIINGITYIDYPAGSDFPYNATIQITSVGVYEFEFGNVPGGGNNPGGCANFTPEAVCGCNYFATFNEAGTFVISTQSAVPSLGVNKTYALGCTTRQVSLFTKFNQLNGGSITGGGTWTLDFVSAAPGLPFTCLVNGVSTTFTALGQTVGVGDPLVDLTGMPNPSNYIFKYTVTNACGTAFKTLTTTINCNNCNKVINTVAPTTNCTNNITIVHPVTSVLNNVRITTPSNSFKAVADWNYRFTDCDSNIENVPIDVQYSKLSYKMTSSASFVTGSYVKILKLFSNTIGGSGFITLDLNPTTTPYLSGCSGPAIDPATLYHNQVSKSTYTNALTKLIRNAICTAFLAGGGTTINTNYEVIVEISGSSNNTLRITFNAKHNPGLTQHICFGDTGNLLTYNSNGSDTTITAVSKNQTGPDIRVTYTGIPSSSCENYYYYSERSGLSGKGIDVTNSTTTNLVLLSNVDTLVINPFNDPFHKATTTCKKWNFATTVSPACSGAATYSYKVNGVTIPETTATFVKKTKLTENNPFNPCGTGSQDFETTVGCDGCTGANAYVKKTMTFNC